MGIAQKEMMARCGLGRTIISGAENGKKHLGVHGEALKWMNYLEDRKGKFRASATHQIGTVFLEAHRCPKAAGLMPPDLEGCDFAARAKEAFRRAAELWQDQGNYRSGYSFRRYGCTKYVSQVREAIVGLCKAECLSIRKTRTSVHNVNERAHADSMGLG